MNYIFQCCHLELVIDISCFDLFQAIISTLHISV